MRKFLVIVMLASFELILSSPALAQDDFKDVCTISRICHKDVIYYQLYIETKIYKTLNAQHVEIHDVCAEDSWKASQAVDYLKSEARKLVNAGYCKRIFNNTRY